jgi:hypothetical protein
MKRKYREQDKEREMKMKTVKEDRTMKWWTWIIYSKEEAQNWE